MLRRGGREEERRDEFFVLGKRSLIKMKPR